MRWLKLFRSRGADREIEAARARTDQSGAQARDDLKASTNRLYSARRVAHELALHNSANRYDDWLESRFLRGGS